MQRNAQAIIQELASSERTIENLVVLSGFPRNTVSKIVSEFKLPVKGANSGNLREFIVSMATKDPNMSQSSIARQLGCSRERVRQILEDEGIVAGRVYFHIELDEKVRKIYAPEMTTEEIANAVGVTSGQAKASLARLCLRVPGDKREQTQEMKEYLKKVLALNQDHPREEIADKFGVCIETVQHHARELGFPSLVGYGVMRGQKIADKIKGIWKPGMKVSEVARKVGCCFASAKKQMTRLGYLQS